MLESGFMLDEDGFSIGLTCGQKVIYDSCQLVSRSRGRLRSSKPGFQSAEVFPEERITSVQALGGHPQCQGRSVLRRASAGRQDFASTHTLVWAEPKPRGERSGRGKPRKIRADFHQ